MVHVTWAVAGGSRLVVPGDPLLDLGEGHGDVPGRVAVVGEVGESEGLAAAVPAVQNEPTNTVSRASHLTVLFLT